MGEHVVTGLASIVVLGVAAQWLAWRFRAPAILLFLLFGFLAGPVAGFLDPDDILGDLLLPVISLSVAVILFEGGLNLRLSELPSIRRIVFGLISIGASVTWLLAAAAAKFVLQLEASLALLLGAILVVSGPTVIVPLLRHVRPIGRIGSILRWEGILIDPLGAMLAVLVFEAIVSVGLTNALGFAALGFLKTIVAGSVIGYLGARFLLAILQQYLVPDFLQNPVSLLMVVFVFALSNAFQKESGLLATTIMGIAMANQSRVDIKHILQFKETLRVLLISGIFVILAARFRMADFLAIDPWRSAVFLIILIFIARPAAVALSTIRSGLSWRERGFLMAVAPRGIVAAAVASVFAIRLGEAGFTRAQDLASITFLVIIGTVIIYGFIASPLARWLAVASPIPQGVLFVGAYPLARAMAGALVKLGFEMQLIDTNWSNISAARLEGLPARFGSALTENVSGDLVLQGIGRLLAMTSNDEVNSLAALHFAKTFGRAEVYQLSPKEGALSDHLRGRVLFGPDQTFDELVRRFDAGAVIKSVRLTKEFNRHAFQKLYGKTAIPLFSVDTRGVMTIITAEREHSLEIDQTLVVLVDAADASLPTA